MSVKANELRLGNYVDYYCEVLDRWTNSKVIDYIDRDIDTDTSNDIEGIKLTEHWLLKFGWVWNEECKSYEKYPNGDVRMNLAYKHVSSSYTMFNYVLKAVICERIFYVHQLQNLYFALTGEELTIKNETK